MEAVTAFPLADVTASLRWLIGFLIVTFLPGYWLVGQRLRNLDYPTRVMS